MSDTAAYLYYLYWTLHMYSCPVDFPNRTFWPWLSFLFLFKTAKTAGGKGKSESK